ncbi:MAG TPA: hypothetical protein VJN72_09325 [Gaiellales bacterium]|nr:hypothetical protein [Gaiellales bacterium]
MRILTWLRATYRRLMNAERTADDLPPEHRGPNPSDLERTMPPGGAGRL